MEKKHPITLIRKEIGISRAKLARLCDLPDKTLRNIEKFISRPRYSTYQKICTVLNQEYGLNLDIEDLEPAKGEIEKLIKIKIKLKNLEITENEYKKLIKNIYDQIEILIENEIEKISK